MAVGLDSGLIAPLPGGGLSGVEGSHNLPAPDLISMYSDDMPINLFSKEGSHRHSNAASESSGSGSGSLSSDDNITNLKSDSITEFSSPTGSPRSTGHQVAWYYSNSKSQLVASQYFKPDPDPNIKEKGGKRYRRKQSITNVDELQPLTRNGLLKEETERERKFFESRSQQLLDPGTNVNINNDVNLLVSNGTTDPTTKFVEQAPEFPGYEGQQLFPTKKIFELGEKRRRREAEERSQASQPSLLPTWNTVPGLAEHRENASENRDNCSDPNSVIERDAEERRRRLHFHEGTLFDAEQEAQDMAVPNRVLSSTSEFVHRANGNVFFPFERFKVRLAGITEELNS